MILVAGVKEAIEDFFRFRIFVVVLESSNQWNFETHRHKEDRKNNRKQYSVIRDGHSEPIRVKSQDIRPGDIVIVKDGKQVPADMVPKKKENILLILFLIHFFLFFEVGTSYISSWWVLLHHYCQSWWVCLHLLLFFYFYFLKCGRLIFPFLPKWNKFEAPQGCRTNRQIGIRSCCFC